MLSSNTQTSAAQQLQTKATYVHDIHEAAALLQQGQLVAFPTETVYGLGADATNQEVVQRIFQVKGRPRTDPLIVHVDSVASAEKMIQLHPQGLELLRKLAKDFWPGPLTVVAPARPHVSSLLTAFIR